MAIYDVFGLSWNSGASLGTKQGYITTLLNNGITPEQIKAKIAELDPSGATEANFKLLGIPEPAPTPPAANQRVEDLANQLGIPKFVIASLVNQGMSDDDIRAKYTSTPEIAEKLIEASMSTGVADTAPTNFNQYGGYDKVLNEYLESGQNLSLASLSPTQLNEAAAKVSTTGSGNLNTLALTGTPITQTALDNMAKNGVDANTIASIKETYSPENIKATQTKALQDLVTNTPNLAETDLFSKYAELAKGYQGTYEGKSGVDFKGASGLREFYGPYVTDYLSRMSGLLAERDSPQYQATKFGTTYGTDTANTLKALQSQRENMMGMGEGAGATPMYTPSKFSFASPNASLTAQGIKSLAKGSAQDKIDFYKDYMQGADQALRNAATTYMGPQSQNDWDYLQSQGLAGFSQGGGVMSLMDDSYADGGFTGQTVPSTFIAPTGGYQQATYNPATMGFATPGTYEAGTIASGFDQTKAGAYTGPAAGKEIASTYTTPTNLYSAGTIGTDFSGIKGLGYTAPAAGKEISSTFTTPTDLYSAGTIGSTFDPTKAGVYTGPEAGKEISSTFKTPTNIYSAGTIGSTYDPVTKSYVGPGTGISTETFDAAAMQRLMNPYTSGVVNPQLEEARRQAEITRQAQASRMAKAGAFGGSRQAIMESELARNLGTQLGTIYGTGQKEAYDAALRAFEAEQGRKLQASTATETARQEAGRQGLSEAQTRAQLGLQAQTAQEQARQAAGQQALTAATTGAELAQRGQIAQEAAKQAAGTQALTAATTQAELAQRGQIAQEAAKQAAGQQALTAATTAAQLGLQGQTAQEAAKQAAGQQALSAAQTAGQLGLQAQTAQEAARQAAGQQALTSAQTAAQLGLQGQTAQEQARQAAGQQAINAAQIAAQLGLQGSELSERSRQFAANYGLQTAQTAAQYDQQARQLQQQAEEAQARGDQFGASLALQQLQEAQRAAETTRAFEYQQARDTYLDPYREIMYANQVLGGLPISAAATGISPNLEALVAALGLGTALKSV
jgi:hypothetical protein